MSFEDKIDALDLVIRVLKEHEKKLDEVVSTISKLTYNMTMELRAISDNLQRSSASINSALKKAEKKMKQK